MRSVRGFTLVELMATVAVLAVIMSIAIPMYQGYLATGRQNVLRDRVAAFLMFEENYQVENGAYYAGTYTAGGSTNTAFENALGYRIPNDNDAFTMTVEAGACGDLAQCFKVTASDNNGNQVVWDAGTYTWVTTE